MENEFDPYDLSEGDEDYVPNHKEEEIMVQKRKPIGAGKIRESVKQLLREMEQFDLERVKTRVFTVQSERGMDFEDKLRHAQLIIDNMQKKMKPTGEGTFHFAGKVYKLNENGELEEIKENNVSRGFSELNKIASKYTKETSDGKRTAEKYLNIEEKEYRQILKEKKNNLKSLMGLLNNRHRNMSAIYKSKIDWKKYTSANQLEKQLEQNRKNGFIEKQKFLGKSATGLTKS